MKKKLYLNVQKFLVAGIFLFIGTPAVHAVDYLFDNTAPVVLHKRKKTSYTFSVNNDKTIKKTDLDSYTNELILGVFFIPPVTEETSKIDKEALTYQAVEACSKSEVTLDEVFHHTPGSDALDVLIYDPRYASERKLGKDYSGVNVPWDPLYDISDGKLSIDAQMQDLARVLAPDCLPARFRFVYVGSKRYQEIRYGKKAWEKVE